MSMENLDVHAITEQFNQAFAPLRAWFTQAVPVIQSALTTIYGEFHARYVAAGAIYGDTHEGMMRWLGEMAEIRRHQQAIEYIQNRQWAIADFRRQLAERHK